MTVTELISCIMNAYPGATPDALKSFTPVFYARLRKHEGPALEEAATEVLGSFKPRFDQKFPIPIDFEQHLPSGKLNLPSSGPAIDFKAHKRRKVDLISEWEAGQGAKILKHRGAYVWTHCWLEVKAIAQMRAWTADPEAIILTLEQIDRCEHQVISTARMATFGARRSTLEEWQDQMANCAEKIRAGEWPKPMVATGEILSSIKPSKRMTDRLAQLAAARRRGEPPPPRADEIPEVS